jgi:hypothetical protein
MLSLSEKKNLKYKKIFVCISSYFMCARQFCEKRNIFVCYAKMVKKSREKAYFSIKFCHFYIGHIKSLFLLNSLGGHLGHGDTYNIFI